MQRHPDPWMKRPATLGRRRCVLGLAGAALGLSAHPGRAQATGSTRATGSALRFGILPIGGTLDSRNDWEPLLADLGRALERPIAMLSVTAYETLAQAIERSEVDLAFLSG